MRAFQDISSDLSHATLLQTASQGVSADQTAKGGRSGKAVGATAVSGARPHGHYWAAWAYLACCTWLLLACCGWDCLPAWAALLPGPNNSHQPTPPPCLSKLSRRPRPQGGGGGRRLQGQEEGGRRRRRGQLHLWRSRDVLRRLRLWIQRHTLILAAGGAGLGRRRGRGVQQGSREGKRDMGMVLALYYSCLICDALPIQTWMHWTCNTAVPEATKAHRAVEPVRPRSTRAPLGAGAATSG